ncbi:MAG: UvrB/UvrC motif-containing protein [Candidatus Sumerlaeia bacterium]|nr:UvrB/UvrC motif-containing protein [Candidatus Sumerlaeia bacterium]
MKCTKCGKHEVSFKITIIERGSGVAEERLVCQQCAAEHSPYIAKMMAKPTVAQVLEDLLKQQLAQASQAEAGEDAPAEIEAVACAACDLSFVEYKASGMLGCPECYDAFGDPLLEDIRRCQGTDAHVGWAPPAPSAQPDLRRKLEAMRSELQDCIENEDFERAAFLRDEIKKTTEELRRPLGGEALPEADA